MRIDVTQRGTWFTGDTHFHHKAIVGLTNRPFADVEEMNQALVARWNERVAPGDLVFHLGDFLLYKNKLEDWRDTRAQLNGEIILIRGNHDYDNARSEATWGVFDASYDYLDLSIRETPNGKYNRRVVLCHYPLISWRGRWGGSFHFHGHSHGGVSGGVTCGSCWAEVFPPCRRVDVGVDCWGFAPVRYEALRDMLLTIPEN